MLPERSVILYGIEMQREYEEGKGDAACGSNTIVKKKDGAEVLIGAQVDPKAPREGK